MNDPQIPSFADVFPNDGTIITVEIVDSETLAADNAEIERLDPENQALADTIARLQQELSEMKGALETQTRRLRSCDTLLARQNEELQYERQQLQRAIAEVESYREIERVQQRSLTTLSEELAGTREQLVRLERECTLLQENYNEQTQRLLSAEKQVDELHSRLQRQQRYTLQYKTALDQCLGVSAGPTPPTTGALVSRTSPIEPWSSPTESEETLPIPAANEDDIDEFLAEFERVELSEPSTRDKNDWPSPVIFPYTPRYPAIRVDLPTFLKNRPDNGAIE